jgi:hypothetical protein
VDKAGPPWGVSMVEGTSGAAERTSSSRKRAGKRPCRSGGESPSSDPDSEGDFGCPGRRARAIDLASPAKEITSSRDMRCPSRSGLGQSSRREQSRREVPRQGAKAPGHEESAPDPSSTRPCLVRKSERAHRAIALRAKVRGASDAMRVPSIRWSCLWIVSIAEVDERHAASSARERRARGSGEV